MILGSAELHVHEESYPNKSRTRNTVVSGNQYQNKSPVSIPERKSSLRAFDAESAKERRGR